MKLSKRLSKLCRKIDDIKNWPRDRIIVERGLQYQTSSLYNQMASLRGTVDQMEQDLYENHSVPAPSLLEEFAGFVAWAVTQENFESNAGFFAELACRKLHKLGIVQTIDDLWVYEDECSD